MKRILPAILIVLGIAEIIIAVMDIKTPVIIVIALGMILIALGIRTWLDAGK